MSNWIQYPLLLEGPKVKLIPLEKEHFDTLLEIGKDPRIWEFMPVDWLGKKELPEVLQDAVNGRNDGSQYPFVAIDKTNGKIFGSTRFLRLNKDFRTLEIGWTWYSPAYWNTGYNKECKFLMLQYCFETLQTISVNLGTATDNIRSQKAIEGIGAKYEGTVRNRLISGGKKKSFKLYSITDEEWPEIKIILTR